MQVICSSFGAPPPPDHWPGPFGALLRASGGPIHERAMQVLAFDLIDGRLVPAEHDYSAPPEGLSRQQRRAWERRYRDRTSQYDDPADIAWYNATKATAKHHSHEQFQKAALALFAAYERDTGIAIPWEMSDEQVAAWAARNPEFRRVVEKIDVLRRRWMGA